MLNGSTYANLLVHRSATPFEADINETVNKIVGLGQTLGIDDIDAEAVIASLSVQAEALTDEDLVDYVPMMMQTMMILCQKTK